MMRVEKAKVDDFWLATTRKASDDKLAELAESRGWRVFRGAEEDVFSRFLTIARISKAEWMIRLTGDNPFTHYAAIDSLVAASASSQADWFGDMLPLTYPIGLCPEIFTVSSLEWSHQFPESLQDRYRTHVTTLIRMKRECRQVDLGIDIDPNWRFTVDTRSDLEFLRKFSRHLGYSWLDADLSKVAEVTRLKPELRKINESVRQRQWSEG